MKRIKGILATTHRDSQGESIPRHELQQMTDFANRVYIPMGTGHDPRIPPNGRVVNCEVIPLGDGHYGIQGTIECWEETDAESALRGDGRMIHIDHGNDALPIVHVDYAMLSAVDRAELIADLKELKSVGAEIKYHAKKAVEPLSTLMIAFGGVLVGGIGSGFLSKVGEDLYEALKSKTKKWLSKPKPNGTSDRLLVVKMTAIDTTGRIAEAQLILTNPTQEQIDHTFGQGLVDFQRLVEQTMKGSPEVVMVVAEENGGGAKLLYTVSSSGVPSPITFKDIPDGPMGVSLGAVASLDLDSL